MEKFEKNLKELKKKENRKIRLKIGNQGKLLLGIITILFGYFGLIANNVMYDEYGYQIPVSIWDGISLLHPIKIYPNVNYLPIVILSLICFLITISEDIFWYGLKHSFWFATLTNVISIIWYWFIKKSLIVGFKYLLFDWEGIISVLTVFSVSIFSSLVGFLVKKEIKKIYMISLQSDLTYIVGKSVFVIAIYFAFLLATIFNGVIHGIVDFPLFILSQNQHWASQYLTLFFYWFCAYILFIAIIIIIRKILIKRRKIKEGIL